MAALDIPADIGKQVQTGLQGGESTITVGKRKEGHMWGGPCAL